MQRNSADSKRDPSLTLTQFRTLLKTVLCLWNTTTAPSCPRQFKNCRANTNALACLLTYSPGVFHSANVAALALNLINDTEYGCHTLARIRSTGCVVKLRHEWATGRWWPRGLHDAMQASNTDSGFRSD